MAGNGLADFTRRSSRGAMPRTGRPPSDPQKRFWSKVSKSDTCWLWTGTCDDDGYGEFWAHVDGVYRKIRAHRYSWLTARGTLTVGLSVLHSCDNRRCVRPDHLCEGTNQDNVDDRNAKQRQARGAAIHTAKLTDADVRLLRQLHAAGASVKSLAAACELQPLAVQRIVTRETWRHV